MIILSAKDLTKTYGVDVILQDVSFHINEGDRIGIIGANGAGKTTLLKMLSGELSCDGGDFFLQSDKTVGYLKQSDNFRSEHTVIEEVEAIFSGMARMEEEMLELSAAISEKAEKGESGPEVDRMLARYDQMQQEYRDKGGYSYKSEMNGVLSSMAFGEEFYNKKISTLSGGERTRLALACLLLKKPDLLFLDEPTNHLDIGTLKWLEQYLKAYKGTILLVSHDRYFLDQIVNRIFEVENHRLETYEGSYSQYAEQKKQRRETQLRQYQNQQKEIARQEDMIRRFKERGTEKLAKRAASREKRLAAMDRVERPEPLRGKMKLRFHQNFKSGNDVLLAEDLAKSFGYGMNEKRLFSGVNFDIKRGERICIVGPNGVGKTTLLKVIRGELSPSGGRLKVGYNVEFGYYDQEQSLLNDANTVLEELHDAYRLYTDTEPRSILGRFLFQGEDVFLKVGSLSGGEKARLSLLKLMMSGPNVLLLDEPTNHLDIESRKSLKMRSWSFREPCWSFPIDRHFLNKIPTRIFELGQEGITSYLGTYNYYVEKKQEIESGKQYLETLARGSAQEKASEASDTPQLNSSELRKLKKEEEARQRRLKRQQEDAEKRIEKLEAEISEIEEELCREEVMVDPERLRELSGQMEQLKQELSEEYDKWMELQEI